MKNDKPQGGNTNSEVSDLAPTTSTVSAPPRISFGSAGSECMSEDECIATGVNFAGYERGVSDAIDACEKLSRIAAPSSTVSAPTADLLLALRQVLNFVEHSEANKGKSTTDAEWDANVEAFRKSGTARIGIGRSYTDKAFVDLTFVRAAIANAEAGAGVVPTVEDQDAKDAARYRLLRDVNADNAGDFCVCDDEMNVIAGEELDAAIDGILALRTSTDQANADTDTGSAA